jgi:hypothetical protein
MKFNLKFNPMVSRINSNNLLNDWPFCKPKIVTTEVGIWMLYIEEP